MQVCLAIRPDTDHRVFNLPTVDEIAAIVPQRREGQGSEHQDIVVQLKQGGLRQISHLHPSYSPLHYVLLFPHGDAGFHLHIPSVPGPHGRVHSKNISQRCYYVYRLHTRPNEPSALLYGGRLLQQYMVDAWASCEESELFWIQTHQNDIRADLYQGLRDAVEGADGDVDLAHQGNRIILPSSHSGSTRQMYQLFQDSLAISRHCRKPGLFITMTANPNWPEVLEALLAFAGPDDNDPDHHHSKQTTADRPDIVVHVFYQKMDALLKDIRGWTFWRDLWLGLHS